MLFLLYPMVYIRLISFQVMAVCAHENMNMIAVGFQNGTVIVIRGNITRDRMARIRIVHEEDLKGDRVYVTGTVH